MVTVAQEIDVESGRLAHLARDFGGPDQPQGVVAGAQPTTRRPALALTAEGPRRADLIAWTETHHATLTTMRLLAPASTGTLLAQHVGLSTEPLRSGTLGPAATAALAAAGDIDAMVAFTDPIELRPGDNTTRALTRLAVFWDIPIAGNRATADLLLASLRSTGAKVNRVAETAQAAELEPVRGAEKLWNNRSYRESYIQRLPSSIRRNHSW
jgi:methylglyoxal synthase